MKKLMMLSEYPPSEASAGGGSMRGALAAAMPLLAATEKVGGYTWMYRINDDTAENVV